MGNWQDTYHNLDPSTPLSAKNGMLEKGLYINDFFNSVKNVVILNKDKKYKLLLSGHTGCGKSTFLNLLEDDDEMNERFHIVKYSIKDILDTNDIDHIDLLLSIVAKTLTSLPENAVNDNKGLFAKAEKLAAELQGTIRVELEDEEKCGVKAGGEMKVGQGFFDFLKVNLFMRLQYEQESRKKIREYYKPRITDFISAVNSILLETEAITGKKILILIDDTDKTPPEKGLELFLDNGHHLSAPRVNILFVIDVSIATSTKFSIIKSKFGGEEFFPAIKIREKNSTQSDVTKQNVKMLMELARKRIPEEDIDEAALIRAIESSGGVVRELIRMLQYAVFNAKGRVHTGDVDYARMKIANEYNLFGVHTRIMKKVEDDPDWLSREVAGQDDKTQEKTQNAVLELLHMPVLFQYRNGNIKWYRPYPIFTEWLGSLYPGKQGDA